LGSLKIFKILKFGAELANLEEGIGPRRCCYITVDSAMAASQNGFCSYKLSFHKNQYYADYEKKILQFLFI